jgi:vancomycin resistance protein YoaR
VRFLTLATALVIASASFVSGASAAPMPSEGMTLRYLHHIFTVPPKEIQVWQSPQEIWMFNGVEIDPPAELRVDGDHTPPLPEGMVRSTRVAWNENAIRATLAKKASSFLDRPAGSVVISRSSGAVVFQGVGLPGRTVDLEAASLLVMRALEQGVWHVWLPVRETPPNITVTDPELTKMGIKEVVTVGESDMSNSPANRIHNINVGLNRFNGHVIQKGETFSFLKVLGPVDASTGYRRELVIKGPLVVPDYGGGLCQVSSTAYRGVWEYGFPIVKRINHSFAVNHYMPYGTDATVFTGGPDIQFLNDSPGALAIQTHAEGDFVHFIYYGTKDDRTAKVIGPFVWDKVGPPPAREALTTDIPVGTRRKVGDPVPGLKAMWYRVTQKDGKELTEDVYSVYGARPLFYQVGVSGLPTTDGEILTPGDVMTEE